MTIRRGKDEFLEPEEFRPIDLSGLVEAMRLGENETMADVFSRLDADRVAGILGVTEKGGFDTPTVLAFGEKLFTNFNLAVDLLVIPPGSGFPPHVHPGHHLLYCLAGKGTFSINGVAHEVKPGFIHMVEGNVPHAVGNPFDQPHVLLAFGSPPKELDAPDRMQVVNWNGKPIHVPQGESVEDYAALHGAEHGYEVVHADHGHGHYGDHAHVIDAGHQH